MGSIGEISRELADATMVADLLSAARGAFEVVLALSGEYAEADDSLVAAFAEAMAAAADGRDAVALAPSLRGQPAQDEEAARSADAGAREVAAALAALSDLLAARLDQGVGAARNPGDRRACRRAAAYAREIRELFGWAGS